MTQSDAEQGTYPTDETSMEHGGNTQSVTASVHNSSQPIMNLPIEILSSIFLFASSRSDDPYLSMMAGHLDGDEESILHNSLPSCSFVSLNLVCKQARSVALISPRCWVDILVIIKNNQVINPPSLLSERLNRSKEVHIRLFFFTTYPNPLDDHQESAIATGDRIVGLQTLELLGPHVHRCHEITFYTPHRYLSRHPIRTSRVLLSFPWSYPSLQHLTVVDFTYSQGDIPYSLELDRFWSPVDQSSITCVELMFVTFSGDIVAKGNLIAPIGVTHLRLERGYDVDNVISFLCRTTQLEHLDWDAHSADDLFGSDSDLERDVGYRSLPTVLPSLVSLRLRAQAPHPGSFGLVAKKCKELYLHERTDMWNEANGRGRPHWDRITLPQLKRFSIQRPASEDQTLWAGFGDFLDQHPALEDLIVYSPLRWGSKDQNWRWLWSYLAGSHHIQLRKAITPSNPSSHTDILPYSDVNTSYSLPKLRTLWFDIDPRQWTSDRWPELIAFITAVLQSRPDVVINLRTEPISTSEGVDHGNDEEGEWSSFFPLELQAVAADFSSQKGGPRLGTSGRLKLLSSPKMLLWPEAWGCIDP